MPVDTRTVDTYNEQAIRFASYYDNIPAREKDIKKAIELLGSVSHPIRIVEIGCGDGRDAEVILNYTNDYVGLDPSKAFINLARQRLPNGNFVIGDAESFDYGNNIDIVFAFASLLHINRESLAKVVTKVESSLSDGGILYMSLKSADEYEEVPTHDEYGFRQFYRYSPDNVRELVSYAFEEVYFDTGFVSKGSRHWFEIAFKRKTK